MAEDENKPPSAPEPITEEQVKALQEVVKLKAEELKIAQQAAAEETKALNAALKKNKALKDNESLQQLIAAQKDVINSKDDEELQANQEIYDELKKRLDLKKEEAEEILPLLDEELEARREAVVKSRELADVQGDVADKQKAIAEYQRQIEEAIADSVANMKALGSAAQAVADVGTGGQFSAFAGGFASMAQAGFKMSTALDQAQVSLARSTGMADQLAEPLRQMTIDGADFGLSMADNAEILTSLVGTMTTFSKVMDGEFAQSLMDTAQEMKNLGVDSGEFGTALDNLMRTMGHTDKQAIATSKEFISLGKSLKLPTGQVVADFNKLAPSLAKYGKDATKIFKGLAKQARSLGVSVQEAFDITDQLDTFEGSAQMIGTINAQLGIQLNSVELMAATDEERLEMLTQGIREGMGLADGLGKKFEDLHRREQQAIAQMMGVPVGTAARLLGDPEDLEAYNKEQALANERREKFVSVTEKLTAAGERLVAAFGPFFNLLSTIAEVLATKAVSYTLMFGAAVMGIAKAVIFGVNAYKAYQMALQATTAVELFKQAIGLKTQKQLAAEVNMRMGNTKAIGIESQAKSASIGPTVASGKAAKGAAKGMLQLGVAILLIGAGVGLAAAGLSLLVSSFGELNTEQIVGAAVAMGILTAAFYFMIPAIGTFAATAGVAAAPIGALGLAILGIGAGVALAAAGIALLVYSFTGLVEQLGQLRGGMLLEVSGGFYGLAMGITAITLSLGILFAAMAGGIGGLAAFLAIGALAAMLMSLGEASSELAAAGSGLEAVAKIMTVTQEVDDTKLQTLDNVMKSIAEVGVSMSAADNANMKALADAVKSLAGGGAGGAPGGQRTEKVILKVYDYEFGEVVNEAVKRRNGPSTR